MYEEEELAIVDCMSE
jgi:hypothetical protein